MPNQTTNYKLTKPLASELYDIDVQNENMDIIDETLKDIETEASKHFATNLLDNSDFTHPVNQRGETSYTGPYPCLDRWKQATVTATVSVADGGLSLTATTERCWLYQPLAKQLTVGKKYTLYVEFADGEKYAGVLEATTSNRSLWGNSRVLPTLSYNDFAIIVEPGNSVTIKYAALYEGEYSTETVPTYQPKGYAQELAECQRYYWQMSEAYMQYGYGDAYGQMIVDIILPVEMRVNPTVTHTLDNLAKGQDSFKSSVKRVDVTATTKKVRFAIVTLDAGLLNQLMFAVFKDIKVNAEL